MRVLNHYSGPLESPDEILFKLRQILRWIRNSLIVGVALVLFVELIGEPYLRCEYRYRGSSSNPHIVSATYFGMSGRLEAHAYQYGEGCPLVVFVKPKNPFWHRATNWMSSPQP